MLRSTDVERNDGRILFQPHEPQPGLEGRLFAGAAQPSCSEGTSGAQRAHLELRARLGAPEPLGCSARLL